jgi:glycosyltransferase involved in cell wall biosynthesis
LLIIGDGEERPNLEAMCKAFSIDDRVMFLGSMSTEDARSLLYKADLFVFPTRSDSWGVVVNEALLAGVPVICSDMCGAKVLLNGLERGDIFRSDSEDDLRRALITRFSKGKTTVETGNRIEEWSEKIQGRAIANYFVRVVDWAYYDGARPAPPWEQETCSIHK